MRSIWTGIVGAIAALVLLGPHGSGAFAQRAQSPELGRLIDKGDAERRSGLYEESIQTLERALALAPGTSDVDGEWQARAALALTYEVKGDLRRALELHERNRAFAVRHRDQLGSGPMNREIDSLSAISRIYTLTGNPAKAADVLKEHPVLARPGKERTPDFGRAKHLQQIGINLFLAGKTEEAGKTLAAALAEFEADFTWREKVAPGFWDYESQVEVIRWLQAVRVAQGRTDEALELTERGRARDLAALLAARRAPKASPQGEAAPNLARIRQVAGAQRTTLVVYSILYAYDPGLPLQFSRFDQLPVRDLFIWVIPPGGNTVFRRLSLAQRPESLVDLVRDARASTGVRRPADAPGLAAASGRRPTYPHLRRLHDLLIGPIADLLPADPTQRVTFVPQDVLLLVPFAALQDERGRHLVERHAISTVPSVRVLDLVTAPSHGSRDDAAGVLIVGNPKMPRIRRSRDGPPEILDSLPGTEREATAVARLLKSPALIGEQATKANVLPRMRGAGVVHLATHGLLDEAGRDFHAVALAPDKHDSGLLTAREVRALRLGADLVVLSACDTGRGEITGDGIDGIARSFLAAGARSLVVSLWPVADEATVVLMASFYERLQQGQDKAQALREAMLVTRGRYPDPRRWSAFTLVDAVDASAGLQALLRGDVRAQPGKGGRQDGTDLGPYRYFVFPVPDGARQYRESSLPDGGEVSVFFHTDLGAAQLLAFFRRELTRRGLREDARQTSSTGREFQLVFEGLPRGVVVVQGTGASRGDEGSVSLRVEPRRR
jgi:CHAT domain-containing protein